MGVKTAFLHADLEEDVYMVQPEGFEMESDKPKRAKLVCRLRKALYGLKQSSKQWYLKFDKYMQSQGYERSQEDHCLYTRKLSDGSLIILILYVNDMLIAGKSKDEIANLKKSLSTQFAMKDLGDANHFLAWTHCFKLPKKKRPADSEDKEDRKGKRPMAGLVPDMVGNKPNLDASELCRAWGKVRDQTMLIFFDPGAKANFISPELASKLGIRPEEMEYTAEADKERAMFLQQYSDCFYDSLPSQLPPKRPEDHAIDLVPGSSPPNRPPCRVSAAQQKEIMSQVEELLEKGLIQPSSSPFCSPVLLV
ncbi:hypothetical protein L7F22_023876 [Adiantum nelumboides]|nr:hypothetical protein [Adiantum nelumboides]